MRRDGCRIGPFNQISEYVFTSCGQAVPNASKHWGSRMRAGRAAGRHQGAEDAEFGRDRCGQV